jgi:hypothetical protein
MENRNGNGDDDLGMVLWRRVLWHSGRDLHIDAEVCARFGRAEAMWLTLTHVVNLG